MARLASFKACTPRLRKVSSNFVSHPMNEDKSIDLFGVKPAAKAMEKATEGAVAGAGAFLSRICLPAAEEFGYLLQDRVRAWRGTHAVQLAAKAEQLTAGKPGVLEAHPRLVGE